MATVILVNDNIKVKVPAQTTLRTVATKTGASMEFGCRVGDCTTCIAHVHYGMEYLNQKNDKEIKVLTMLEDDISDLRLMCQCEVLCDEGEVVITYARS